MAINKETQVSASVVLDKNFYKKVLELADHNKRSASSQMAYMLEEYYKIIKTDSKK
jgi:hypothetical protein